jgi:Phosphorylase superfamily
MTSIIVCGMPDEKRILTNALKPGTLILSGTDKRNLPQLVPSNCTRLISMGVCGGLSPELAVACSVLALTVADHRGDEVVADEEWNIRAKASAGKRGVVLREVAYYSSGLFDEADNMPQRAALFAKYGAHAIDDETRFVVAEAQRRKIPFNVARPLSDDASANLPLLATGRIMNPDGSPNMAYLFSALGQDQGENSESVFKVMSDYKQSLDALDALAKALADLMAEG